MWTDPIVEELHAIREHHAKQFNYDINAMAADIKQQERHSGKTYVSLPIQRRMSQPKTTVTITRQALTNEKEYA